MPYIVSFVLAVISSMIMSNVVVVNLFGSESLKKMDNVKAALTLGCTVGCLLIVVSAITYPIVALGLKAANMQYLAVLVVGLVSLGLVGLVALFGNKVCPKGYEVIKPIMPLVALNAAIIGVAVENVHYTFGGAMATTLGAAIGFVVILFLFATIKVKLDGCRVPKPFKGLPILLAVAGVAAVLFMAISGLIDLGAWGIMA